jgi:signal transduction histidine kinase
MTVDRWTRRAAFALVLLALPVIFDYSKSMIIDPAWLYPICGVIGSVAIIVGVRIHRPLRPLAWYLLAAGNLMFVAGDLIYFRLAASGSAPYPGINDIAYLAAYPFLAAGLVGLVRGSQRRRGNFIDTLIIATSAGLLAWVFLMEPYASDPSMTMAEKIVSVAYPMGDLLLLATVCWLLLGQGLRNSSLNWLLVSTAALLIGDTIYGVVILQGAYAGGWTDAPFIVSYLAFGAAAIHPSMKARGPEGKEGPANISRGRLVLLGGAGILGPGLWGFMAVRGVELNDLMMATGTLLLFLLTLLRMAGLMRSVERNAAVLEVQGRDLTAAVDKLEKLEGTRRHLLEEVHITGEKERSALALDIHDGPIQHLTTLSFEVDLAAMAFESGDRVATQEAFQALGVGLSTEIESLRVLMTDLRPPALDERGLVQALGDLVGAFSTRTGIHCKTDLDIDVRLDREIETLLYRIAQESLANVAKHSSANHVFFTCRARNKEVEMEILDDGTGFESSLTDMSGMDGHLGLASIKERIETAGGRCSIVSSIGNGTEITVSMDLERNKHAEAARITG